MSKPTPNLVVEWANGGSTAPFSSNSSVDLVVNLADANPATGPADHHHRRRPEQPAARRRQHDAQHRHLGIQQCRAFANALSSTFKGTNKIWCLAAYGRYDIANNTFVAARINVALHE